MKLAREASVPNSRAITSAQLRIVAVTLGMAWALAFVTVGVIFRLQFYGDGSAFSYGIALGENWEMHWHNLATRIAVYLFFLLPAQAVTRAAQSAVAGTAVYALLFFGAQLAGLLVTYRCDRSPIRTIFTFACVSTAIACPLVFGFPTEMWIAHAAMWPALAVTHFASPGPRGWATVIAAFILLVFTHEGAVVFALAIAVSALMHGWRSPIMRRAVAAFAVAIAIWLLARKALPPDAYFAPVFATARLHFFDARVFTSGVFACLAAALAGLAALMILLRGLGPVASAALSSLAVTAALSFYWLVYAPPLHADNRYYLRTALLILTPVFAAFAVLSAIPANDAPPPLARLSRIMRSALTTPGTIAFASAALFLATVIHTVKTLRFVTAWSAYTDEIRQLASKPASASQDNGPFVSSERVSPRLRPLAWSSTTPFLSVLVAPNLNPSRLVVDPTAGYFWLSCSLSAQNETAGKAIPKPALALIRDYSCRHRPG